VRESSGSPRGRERLADGGSAVSSGFSSGDHASLVTGLAILLSLVVGGVVGVTSGLLGIGGGVLMVPFLYFLMGATVWSGISVPLEHQAALAHATSLAVIVPAALSGLLEFRRMGVVPWRTILPLGGAAALAALIGARVAIALPTPVLKLAFGAFVLVSAYRLLRKRSVAERSAEERQRAGPEVGRAVSAGASPVESPGTRGESNPGARPSDGEVPLRIALPGGGAVGFLSALLGVGGGIIAIPILIRWARLGLNRIVPASLAIIAFAAPAGVLSYALAGGIQGLPPGSVGYVYLPSALAMIPGAALLAPVGARWNQRMGAEALRLTFGALLLVVGLQLVWANGPQVIRGF